MDLLFYGCEFNLVLRIVSRISVFIGVCSTFIPIHLAGLQCTPRRYSDYPDVIWAYWIFCSVGAITSFTGMIVYLWSIGISVLYMIVGVKRWYSCILYYSSSSIIGIRCSIWYWHLVDGVWLILVSCIYWWGL